MRDKEFRENGTMKENVVSPKKNDVENEKKLSYGAEILMECIALLKDSIEKV
jgi:hypothetical protein